MTNRGKYGLRRPPTRCHALTQPERFHNFIGTRLLVGADGLICQNAMHFGLQYLRPTRLLKELRDQGPFQYDIRQGYPRNSDHSAPNPGRYRVHAVSNYSRHSGRCQLERHSA